MPDLLLTLSYISDNIHNSSLQAYIYINQSVLFFMFAVPVFVSMHADMMCYSCILSPSNMDDNADQVNLINKYFTNCDKAKKAAVTMRVMIATSSPCIPGQGYC